MGKMHRQMMFAAFLSTAAAALAGCGDGGGGGGAGGAGNLTQVGFTGKTTQSEVSQASVADALQSASLFLPACSSNTGVTKSVKSRSKTLRLNRYAASRDRAAKFSSEPVFGLARTVALQASQPSDIAGDCGGKITFSNFTQSATGVTSATVSLVNFCTTDATSNNTLTITGDIPFVMNSDPSTGFTTKLTANAPQLTLIKKNPAGNTLQTTNLGLAGFSYTPGTPGLPPTDAKPDVLAFTELSVKAVAGTQDRSVLVRNAVINQSATPGGSKLTASGRLFRAETGFTDFTTPVPLVLSSLNSNPTLAPGGQILLAGANNTSASLTVSSSTPLIFSTVVNGAPVSNQLSCSAITIPVLQ